MRLGQTFIIGRSENVSITLDDPLVSRQHVSLQLTPSGLLVTDLESTNGTLLDYKKVDASIPRYSRNNDTIQVGKHTLAIRLVGLNKKEACETQILKQPLNLPSDEFQVLGEIGRGATGIVYAAYQKILERNVAIKVPRTDVDDYDDVRQRFLREAQLCCKVNSPFIAAIHDLKIGDNQLYIIMELIDGISLKGRIHNGLMPFYDIVKIGENISLALSSIHRLNVIHRDIKPSNIVIAPEGMAKLIDFGIAKKLNKNSVAECITPSDEGVGTLSYISPEGVSCKFLGLYSDIYSLGATLYHMVTGVTPFSAYDSVPVILEKILHEDPKPIKELRPECPDDLAGLIEQMMKKNPHERPQDAIAIAAQLKKIKTKLDPEDVSFSRTDLIPQNMHNVATDNFIDIVQDIIDNDHQRQVTRTKI
jgi:serine/threonine-protein kinase